MDDKQVPDPQRVEGNDPKKEESLFSKLNNLNLVSIVGGLVVVLAILSVLVWRSIIYLDLKAQSDFKKKIQQEYTYLIIMAS